MSDLLLVMTANAADGTISTLRLHTGAEPRLEHLATSGEWEGCGTFAVDPRRDLVFAAYKGEPAGIATLSLDRETGRLTELARRDIEASMTYLTLTGDGSALLGASYGGGFGAVWPVNGEQLGEPHSRFTHKNLHCIVSDDRFVYAVSLGEDLIAQFSLGEDATLISLEPPTVAAPAGSGPRHLVLDGTDAYLATEFSGEAIHLRRDEDGLLSRGQAVFVVDASAGLSHSRLGAEPREEHLIWGADVHRAGQYLLTSERMSSMITTTTVRPDGVLGGVVDFTPTEEQPRGFGVTADGRYVVAVGERSTHASLYRVEDDGSLTSLDRVGIGAGANWVRFVG